MAAEYGRLELLAPIELKNGVIAHEIVVYRPTCRAMTEVLDTDRLAVQIERFVSSSCKALNGSGEPLDFDGKALSSVDGSELSSIISTMSDEADAVVLEPSGDGISSPFVYTLQRPIKM